MYAISRVDLIAIKMLDGRAQDLEDIRPMKPRPDDVAFVRHYLHCLGAKGTTPEQITEAGDVLESLQIHDHE
ncbi:MAG: hypothetical protein U0573_12125 [Phycisphaerales bacterium]